MKKVLLISSLALSSLGYSYSQTFDLTTGKNNSTGLLIDYGNGDDTWQVSTNGGSSFSAAPVCNTNGVSWDINGCGRWITSKVSLSDFGAPIKNSPVGLMQYKTVFNLPTVNYCTYGKLVINYLGGDDDIEGLYLNGYFYSLTPVPSTDYNPLYQNITINFPPSHLLQGANNIIIKIKNNSEYQGLFLCGNLYVTVC